MARVRGLHRRRCAIAGKIVFELDVKQPVLDAPMAACGPGDTLDIDGDIKARVLRSEYSVRESTLTTVLMLVKRGSPG
jgi:hypothetical protein